ncbi:MAG: oligoendopeptidase F family protein [Clostridia bacterium]|nr:oligoendopeptidase F family protein [Clostridia bacterium]
MEYSWNLSQIFESEQAFEKAFDEFKKDSQQIMNFKGKLNNPKDVYNYLKLDERLSLVADKLGSYLYLRKSLNGKDVWALTKMSELENFDSEFSKNTIFVGQELKKNKTEELLKWKNLPEFADYDIWLDDLIKSKKHNIAATQEKLMIGASDAYAASKLFDVLDNVELKFGKIRDENGKSVVLTQGNYAKYSRSTNREVRKQVSKKLNNAYGALNQTIATNYISHLKFVDFFAKTYKYKSTLARKLEASDLPANLPQNVVANINKFLPLLHSYYAWRKKYMRLDKMYGYDLSCPIVESADNQYSLEDGTKIIKKALLPLGEDYVENLDVAIKDHWFDTRILPAKESGGYCLDVYDVHPFILTNFNGTKDCVSTIAHEFGHAMHNYYTNKSQPFSKAGFDIFVAEIASTVNEVLLARYMIDHSKTKQEKVSNIVSFLTTFIGTVFTQSRYTEFELFVHEKIDKNQPLTHEEMNEFYKGIINKYNGQSVEKTKSGISWSMIPHFYSDFYVFKYVTGFISACAIAEKLLSDKNYYKTYRKFLSGGSSKKPCDLLKDAGVDILNYKTYESAFKMFEQYLNILKED